MTFEQYWTIVVKHWRLVIICFVLVGLATSIVSRRMTPLYQSVVLVQVAVSSQTSPADYTNLLASDQLVQTEVLLATSDPVLRQVASHYPGLTVDRLSKNVSATSKTDTQLFEIDVLDPSPVRAAAIANDIAATLIKQQLQAVQQQNNLSQQQILQKELDNTQQQISSTTNQIAALQANGGSQAQIGVLQAQLSGLQQHYSQWQSVLAQLQLTEAQNGGFLRVVQAAQPVYNRVKPNVFLYTGVGLLAGLALGVLLVVLFELLDTRVRTPDDLVELLDWPVLATISRVHSSKEDVIHLKGDGVNIESYPILRTNIGFSSIDRPLHSIMVTSAHRGEGKSVIAANLAVFVAKTGKRTLLIDADLRHPTLHEKFGLSIDQMGLSNAIMSCNLSSTVNSSNSHQLPGLLPSVSETQLSESASGSVSVSTQVIPRQTAPADFSLKPFIYPVDIPNLWVMPSGPLPPNPPELLDSKAMQCVLRAVANCGAELVIFDAPPLLGLSDACILSSKVDGTLIVVDITRAKKKNLKAVKALLMQAGVRVLGCVVNKQSLDSNSTSYPYYYHRSQDWESKEISGTTEKLQHPKGRFSFDKSEQVFEASENASPTSRLDLSQYGESERHENGR